MNYLFIILPAIAIASVVILYVLTRNAQEIEEELPPVIKFEPRKVTDLSKGTLGTDPVKEEPVVAPKKKKYYKKRTKRSE
jgi:hypothetical protein